MDVYKKIQKELDKGKTVLIETVKRSTKRIRYRLLTQYTAQYITDYDDYRPGDKFENCCWKKTKKFKAVNVNDMKDYDNLIDLKTKRYQVLD